MKIQNLTRQLDILPVDKLDLPITIVGAGAIGSQTAMCLSKMGFEDITIYDFDMVDEENMNCQWYGPKDIGKMKVEALQSNIEDLTGVEIVAVPSRVDIEHKIITDAKVMICAVDSMKVRSELWAEYRNTPIRYWIDPRMAAEEGLLYLVDTRDEKSRERYEKTLYTDEEAVSEACTAKATMYCAMILAGQTAKLVKDIAVQDEELSHTIMMNIRQDAYVSYGRNL